MNKVIYEFMKVHTRIDDKTLIDLRDKAQAEIDRRHKAEILNIETRGGAIPKPEIPAPQPQEQD